MRFAPRTPPPEIGTEAMSTGRVTKTRAVCKTCDPHWHGPLVSSKAVAMKQAIMHAVNKHKWAPGQ